MTIKKNAAPVVAEGWKLVPIMPTHEMVRAACDAIGATNSVRAAIAAAPAHPVAGSPAEYDKAIDDALRFGTGVMSGGKHVPFTEFRAAEPMPASEAPAEVRKAFICKNCDCVYADQAVSECDCMPEKNEFIEGVITYPATTAPVPASEAARLEYAAQMIFAGMANEAGVSTVWVPGGSSHKQDDARRLARSILAATSAPKEPS